MGRTRRNWRSWLGRKPESYSPGVEKFIDNGPCSGKKANGEPCSRAAETPGGACWQHGKAVSS